MCRETTFSSDGSTSRTKCRDSTRQIYSMSLFGDAAAQARTLSEVAHRPWPLNPDPWLMGQTWQRLLFAHWPVARDVLREHVPDSLELEECEGSAWLGITPFRVVGLRLRGLPPVPPLARFLELNCRTYVRQDDRPGIWFFSLDASSQLAVKAAQRTYGLPYRHARIDFDGDTFTAHRLGEGASFSATYRGLGEAKPARPGSLEHFLVERYCLYGGNGELRADIHHPPWQLHNAEASIREDGISPAPLHGEPLFHYAERQDVVIWSPEHLSAA
jgi:uncharacterized protein YqjF (DUF2071 family)